MGIFAQIRERSPFVKFLVNAQKTVWYPLLFAVLTFISGINGCAVYIPILWIMLSFHLFSILFTDDNKVFLTPLLMIYFALGRDTSVDAFQQSNGDMLSFMSGDALVHVVIICAVGVSALILRLIFDGSVASALRRRRFFTYGIVAMDIAFMLNGIFSDRYDPVNLLYGALLAMGFTVVYFLVLSMTERSSDPVRYACYVTVSTAYAAFMQIMSVAYSLYTDGRLFLNRQNGIVINKDILTLGWGISTVIAAIFVLGIPAAMYLAKNSRICWAYYFSCPIFILGTVVINSRCAMAVSAMAFAAASIACCIKGKNKKSFRIYTAICALIVIFGLLYVHFHIVSLGELLRILRISRFTDSGRGALWKNGVEDMLSSPIFGVGFQDGAYTDVLRKNNFYSNMYHCILIQMPAATGIIGCAALIFHLAELGLMLLRKFSVNKFLILLVPIMILTMSLLDNFFFYLQFQLFYGAFCALAERILSDTDGYPSQKEAV